jgi:hypothetical protein
MSAAERFPPDVDRVLRKAKWFPGRDVSPRFVPWAEAMNGELRTKGVNWATPPEILAVLHEFGDLTFKNRPGAPLGFAFSFGDVQPWISAAATTEHHLIFGELMLRIGKVPSDNALILMGASGRLVLDSLVGGLFHLGASIDEALVNLIRWNKLRPVDISAVLPPEDRRGTRMGIAITYANLLEIYPEREILRTTRAAVDGWFEDTRIADFLCETGIPRNPFHMVPTTLAPGAETQVPLALPSNELAEAETEFGALIYLGNFHAFAIFVHPENGKVYSFSDMGDSFELINADLSSFCATIALLNKYAPRGERPEHWEYTAAIDRVRAEVEPFDPTPFNGTCHLWTSYFTSVIDGMFPFRNPLPDRSAPPGSPG